MFQFSLGLVAISLVWVVNAQRLKLDKATTDSNIRKEECRLYTRCQFLFKWKDLSKPVLPLNSSINSSNINIFKYELLPSNETKITDQLSEINVEIFPVQIGRANLTIKARNGSEIVLAQLTILRPTRGIDIAFDVFLWVYVGLVSFAMGAAIHRDLIKEFLQGTKQKEVAITFACQYVIMPLLAYGVTKVFNLYPLQSLTLFIYGCCPSSFESAKWSEIFKGDVDLNKFSSLVSTFFALIMMPAWLYLLGDSFMQTAGIRIPISGLALNMCVLIGPAILGFVLSWLIPDLRLFANIANKLIHSMIFIALFLILILCSRLYAFKLGNPLFILVGPLIAFLGYFIGATVAWIFGFPKEKIKFVSLHTGFQNVVFAFLVVNWNIPSPDVDYVLVCLVPVFLQTSLPIKILFLIQKIKGSTSRRREKRNKPTKVEVDAEKIEQEPMYSERT